MSYLLLTLAAMFWGGNYVVGHILVGRINPLVLTEARWALTAALLMGLYWRQAWASRARLRKSFPVVLFLSLFGQVLFPLTLYIGLQYTSSLNAAIYMSATPCMVLLINKLVFRDSITRNNVFGVLMSSLGVIYLILKGQFSSLDVFRHMNQGDLWTMGSALSWAFYCSFLRKKDRQIPGNAFVATSSLLGALMLIPVVALCVSGQTLTDPAPWRDGGLLAGLAYLIIFPSWLSYVFWNRGIADIGATRGEIYTHIIPLSGGVFSVLFLHTSLAWFHLVSSLLIAVGIWLCSKQKAA
ncbi:DMT family transporter [Affinibrenneria salicis]|uniref:DMT family transporter n=1 Tax=Affinibrenneria salicis TaxID=2590031 RepID=A0A5J5G1A0_9GAMM|nr:DMT family transporter [Affinibrenneria salicis]KAA9000494.1 DMT family transporter [Affinibrenneria salicis]